MLIEIALGLHGPRIWIDGREETRRVTSVEIVPMAQCRVRMFQVDTSGQIRFIGPTVCSEVIEGSYRVRMLE